MKVWIIEDKGPESSEVVGVFSNRATADKWSKRIESLIDNSGALIGNGYPVSEHEIDDDSEVKKAWELHKRWRKEDKNASRLY